MAEAILRHLGAPRFRAISAGSKPAGYIHVLVGDALKAVNVPLNSDQTSKSWDTVAGEALDVVITLCDAAAGETCPVWAGAPIRAHWSLPDPAHHPGTDQDRIEFATRVAQRLRTKIEGLMSLDWSADRKELQRRLQFLGEI